MDIRYRNFLVRVERLLVADYEAARAAVSHESESFDACISAMRQLGLYLATAETPSTPVGSIDLVTFLVEDHFSDADLERYNRQLITKQNELVAVRQHVLRCHHCLDRLKAIEQCVSATATAS